MSRESLDVRGELLSLASLLLRPAGIQQMQMDHGYTRQDGLPADVLESLSREQQEHFRAGWSIVSRTPSDELFIRTYPGVNVDEV